MESLVIVEYRPLLRSCQCFVKRSFDPFKTVITVTRANQVVFQSDSGNFTIQFPESIPLEPEVLSSGVSFMPELVHFRVRAMPPAGTGSFKAEVLLTEGDTNGNKPTTSPYVPDVVLDRSVNLMCATCSRVCASELVLSRILPLPNNEDSDFFCHAHSHTLTIDPRPSDLFYGLYFFRLHCDTLKGPSGVIECEKCCAWLGYKTGQFVQLFNSTVYFDGSSRPGLQASRSINDFLGIMEVLYRHRANNSFMNKVVLHSGVDDHTKKYLLLWIFDKDLSLFKVDGEASRSGDFVRMKEHKVVKILYSLQLGATDLVSQWLESDAVSSVPVALPVLECGLTYLEDMARVIPSVFSKAYDMSLTYVVKLDN